MKSLGQAFDALVIGASGGIGSAFVEKLQEHSACSQVTAVSRSGTGLDLTDENSIRQAAANLGGSRFDLIICATGALTIGGNGPEKTIRTLDPQVMAAQFALNAIGPALVLKHFSPLLRRDRKAVFASISAKVGSIGDNRLGGWISYRASKAALNQIVRTAAIEIGRSYPQAIVVSLHPGTVMTSLSDAYSKGHDRLSPTESAGRMLDVLDGLSAAETGGFYAYDGKPIEW